RLLGVGRRGSPGGPPGSGEGTSASMASPSITTTASGDLILGVFATAEAATYTAGAGFTIQERVPAGSSAKLAVEDLKQASPGPIAATASLASGQAWAAAVAAFRPAPTGPPPPADLALAKT